MDWNSLLNSAVQGAILGVFVGGAQFISNRYLGRILDRIEQQMKNDKNGKNDKK